MRYDREGNLISDEAWGEAKRELFSKIFKLIEAFEDQYSDKLTYLHIGPWYKVGEGFDRRQSSWEFNSERLASNILCSQK